MRLSKPLISAIKAHAKKEFKKFQKRCPLLAEKYDTFRYLPQSFFDDGIQSGMFVDVSEYMMKNSVPCDKNGVIHEMDLALVEGLKYYIKEA